MLLVFSVLIVLFIASVQVGPNVPYTALLNQGKYGERWSLSKFTLKTVKIFLPLTSDSVEYEHIWDSYYTQIINTMLNSQKGCEEI